MVHCPVRSFQNPGVCSRSAFSAGYGSAMNDGSSGAKSSTGDAMPGTYRRAVGPARSGCRSAGEELLLALRVEGQVPVLGGLAVAQAVDVDVPAGAGATAEGHRRLEEDGRVAVVGEDVVDREVLHLDPRLGEHATEEGE